MPCTRLVGLLALPVLAAAKGGGGSSGGCFTPHTEVTLADGQRRQLRDLRPGDVVASWDEAAGRPANATIRAVPSFKRPLADLVEVVFESGGVLQATEDHPFWSAGPRGLASLNPEATQQRYELEADLLQVGTQLENEHQAPVPVAGLRRLSAANGRLRALRDVVGGPIEDNSEVEVLTLCLEPHHWYYAHGVRVHNKGCFAPWTPVLLEDGTEVAMDAVVQGDRVVSWDDTAGSVSTATVVGVRVFPAAELLELSFNGTTPSDTAIWPRSVVLTADHPVFSVRAQGLVSASPKVTAELYDLEVGQMEVREVLQSHLGEAVVVEVAPWPGEIPTVMTLELDRHHWFFAQGLRVHNKGGGFHGGYYGGDWGGRSSLATAITLSIMGSVFGWCCCCVACYWCILRWKVQRPWKRRLAEMATKRQELKGSRGPLPETLRLWGDFKESGQGGKCEYNWQINEDGSFTGSGFDVDGIATVEGKVAWGDGDHGEVLFQESRPGISVEAAGTIQEDAEQPGNFSVSVEYWSSDCKTSGRIQLHSGEAQAENTVASCDQVVLGLPVDNTDGPSPKAPAAPRPSVEPANRLASLVPTNDAAEA